MAFRNFVASKVIPALNDHLLRHVRLKLTTRGTPNRNFTEFFSHLADLNVVPATIIDVGVGRGTESLYRSNLKADFFLVEPVPDVQGLVAKIASRLGAKFFNVAAGAEPGELEFFLHGDITGSSFYRQLEDVPELDGKRIRVPVSPLDDLIPADVKRPCVLKVDTQGAEIQVIRGAERLLRQVDVAIMEASFHQFREDSPEIGNVISEMADRGFVLYETLEGHYRAIDGAMAQIDLVFVPSNSELRSRRQFFDTEQALAYARASSA